MRRFIRTLQTIAASAILFPIFGFAISPAVHVPGTNFVAATVAAPTLSFTSATGYTAVQGNPIASVLTFTAGGSFTGNVAVSVSGLLQGVATTLSSSSVAISGGKGTATLTLTPSVSVAAGIYPFTVTATGSGLTVSHAFNLTVSATAGFKVPLAPTLAIQSTGTASSVFTAQLLPGVTVAPGAAGSNATLASTLPTGLTATAGAPTVGSGTVSFPFTLTGSPQAVAWSGRVLFKIQVTDATSGHAFSTTQYVALTITFVKPTLVMTPSTTQLYLTQGSTVSASLSLVGGGSYYGPVKLAAVGLPSGVTAAWSQNPLTLTNNAGTAVVSMTASKTATPGNYSFSVTGAGDTLNLVNYLRITVLPSTGVTVQVSQPLVSVSPGSNGNLSLTATALSVVSVASTGSGVQAAIQSTLPAGVTAKFGTPVVTNSGKLVTWPLTLTTAGSGGGGIYPVTASAMITDQASGMLFSSSQSFSVQVAQLASVTVGTTPGAAIQPDFLGLSHEWGNLYRYMGSAQMGVNQIYRQLLQNLAANGAAPISIRIGGNSTDVSVMPDNTTDEPLVELATALQNKFILGVNLGSDQPSLTLAQAQNDMAVMPAGSVQALEIGNEPDEYFANGMRSSTYGFVDYLTDFSQFGGVVRPTLSNGAGLAGPAWASTVSLPNLPYFLSNGGASLSVVTQHFYGGSPTSNPVPDVLLTPNFATTGPKSMATAVTQTHTADKKFRVDEIGSFYGAGIPGISNAFESALWEVDTMFEYANVGVDGVNWESSSGNYDSPFQFNTTTVGNQTSYTVTGIAPSYYGMLLFQQATAGKANLLPTTITTSANVKVWATVNASGVHRLVIINKDEAQSGPVVVSMPGYSTAKITRLLAPSYMSTSGVTIGGQTFDTSVDGTIQGTPTQETIQGNNGQFLIPVATTSAVVAVFN